MTGPKFKNYIGQLRLYSLVDLVLLLAAINTEIHVFIGALLLHVGFLAYLELRHSHEYREKAPQWVPYILLMLGIILYARWEAFAYILFSFLYTQKISKLGRISPLCRGLQNFFIVAGIVGYHSWLPYAVFILLVLRNLAGDFRDVEKDTREGLKTLPISLGMKRSLKYIHLGFVIMTSVIWWSVSTLPISLLGAVILIEILSYDLTPR
jgi:4-hydroxybenzoate polyprenyltransferase